MAFVPSFGQFSTINSSTIILLQQENNVAKGSVLSSMPNGIEYACKALEHILKTTGESGHLQAIYMDAVSDCKFREKTADEPAVKEV